MIGTDLLASNKGVLFLWPRYQWVLLMMELLQRL